MSRVIVPAMGTVSKPFSAKSADDGKAPEQVHSTNKSAKVFEFGSIHGLGAKAAS
jgi:hypothetical protein